MSREVGIIGFGRCGRLAAEILGEKYRIYVTDRRDRQREAEARGFKWASLEEIAGLTQILLAVPNRVLASLLDEIAPHLKPGALVVDMGSVKVRPMKWMAEKLPEHARFVGTHPLFGPDSERERGLGGQRIAICAPEGGEDAAQRVAEIAKDFGMEPLMVSADEHDREMARSQALVFLVANAMRRAGIQQSQYGTPSEQRIYSAMRLIEGDSSELYEDIMQLNPYVAEIATFLSDAMRDELARLSVRT